MQAEDKIICTNEKSNYYNQEFVVCGYFYKDGKTYVDLHNVLKPWEGLDIETTILENNFKLIKEDK